MAGSKVSRLQVRLAVLAEQERLDAAPVPLPEAFQVILDSYRPAGVDSDTWAAVQAAHRDVMYRSALTGKASFVRHLGVVAQFLVWRHRQSQDIAAEVSFTYPAIDAFYLNGMPGLQDATRNEYRSRLMGLAPKVNRLLVAPASFEPAGYQHIRPGYTPAEEAAIRRVALRQRRAGIRRQLCVIVGLGAGAGLDSVDLRDLRAGDIELADDAICVHVPGRRPRISVVRADYEELVRVGIDGVRPGGLLLGRDPGRKSITGHIIDRADVFEDVPKIEINRLRSTWLAALMQSAVPLQVILQAAGLRSARSLTDLLPHLPQLDQHDRTGLLRGTHR